MVESPFRIKAAGAPNVASMKARASGQIPETLLRIPDKRTSTGLLSSERRVAKSNTYASMTLVTSLLP
jgi:hypothetical protein